MLQSGCAGSIARWPAIAQQVAEAPGKPTASDAIEWDWAMDFAHDQLNDGNEAARADDRRHVLPFLAGVEPRYNFRGADVVEVLERVGREVGFPAAMRTTRAPAQTECAVLVVQSIMQIVAGLAV